MRIKGLRRALLAIVVTIILGVAALPAHAQQLFAAGPPEHDKVRVSGFIWRAKPAGTLDFEELSGFPGFQQGIDVTEELGFVDPNNGWILEGNFAAGKRHRFIIEVSRLESSGDATIDFPGLFPLPPLTINASTDLNLREFHAFYNFLFVARPRVEAGILAGVGWFDTEAILLTNVGSATASLDQAFPSFGANLMLNPQGPVRGYLEISGFPRVEIEDLSGWQLDLHARLEVFPVHWVGFLVGYRRYHLVFDHGGEDFGIDLTWDGLTFGAQLRY